MAAIAAGAPSIVAINNHFDGNARSQVRPKACEHVDSTDSVFRPERRLSIKQRRKHPSIRVLKERFCRLLLGWRRSRKRAGKAGRFKSRPKSIFFSRMDIGKESPAVVRHRGSFTAG
jgi:hypothetical protein